MTVTLKCTCASEFQDKLYGKGIRLHNIREKGDKKLAYCTVCCTRSSDKQTKDADPKDHKLFGVKFETKTPKSRIGKSY